MLAVIGITVRQATAHSTFTGKTLKTSTTGCGGCHASQSSAVVVAISGPDTLYSGKEGLYQVKISGGSGTTVAVNVAASTGATLKTSDNNMRAASGELTSNGAKSFSNGSYTYTFKVTAPATGQSVTLYATGLSSKQQFNFAPNKVVKVLSSVTAADASPALPAARSMLLGNYPEPFRSSTTVNYSLADQGRVRLAVYDLVGQAVDVLANSVQEAGTHAVSFNASQLPAGIYVVRLTGSLVNGETVNLTRRMVLAR